MTHEELKDLLPLKALDRLEPDEEREVEAHLAAGCDECKRDLRSFRETLAAMAIASTESGDPSDRISRILEDRLRAESSGPSRSAGRASDISQRAPGRWSGVAAFAAAAAAVLAIVLGYRVWNIEQTLAVQRANTVIAVAALRAQIDQLRRGIESASAQLDDLKSQIRDTTTLTLAAFSPDSHVVRLAGMP